VSSEEESSMLLFLGALTLHADDHEKEKNPSLRGEY
jgi:hypothetical protein